MVPMVAVADGVATLRRHGAIGVVWVAAVRVAAGRGARGQMAGGECRRMQVNFPFRYC